MQGISLPLDVIIRYSTIIVWVIVAIVIAKIISELVWWLLKKANFLKKAFKKDRCFDRFEFDLKYSI